MSHSDTAPDAEAVQLEAVRALSGEERIVRAFEMSMFAKQLAREGMRRQHPDWDEPRLDRELLRIAFSPTPLPAGLL